VFLGTLFETASDIRCYLLSIPHSPSLCLGKRPCLPVQLFEGVPFVRLVEPPYLPGIDFPKSIFTLFETILPPSDYPLDIIHPVASRLDSRPLSYIEGRALYEFLLLMTRPPPTPLSLLCFPLVFRRLS